ncbi:hypothetical protein BM536_008865 [Streptomyces phaeoluteigriseus]|uniref:DUF485 domain-containing protein n=1 Tax=Streptomyces phaeoluteigriseus TaxID=114686 RepID=A0A1V6MVP2_9ACTN|nr:DUF485 domain-containing protein [Streptomyces phaeoluteigriseus]OQD56366.1 hypothetical protein BM536_008865 [Streptomyces phaeoluteigriseus]
MQSSNGRARGGERGSKSSGDHRQGMGPASVETPGGMRYEDPWYDALASGWGEAGTLDPPVAEVPAARRERTDRAAAAAQVYVEVQSSEAFREVRSRYRRFVIPAVIGFFLWYAAYVVTATAAPGFMARPVWGAVNVALLAGLGQFVSTFLLTWAYSRHARLHRDRAALELRWDTQELTREARGGAA